ncbi:MAG: hypothetical protein IKJ59_09735 [Clostridia bacterium]|nr:hypothetical protein [Clostridia bacterium]
MKNKVIAWGRDDFNMLGLIRELGQSGLDLLFLSYGKTKICTKSKYCTKYHACATLKDGLDFLLNNFSNEETKPIIIASGDDVITFIDKHKNELDAYFLLPGTKRQGDIQKYIDKYTMTKLADEIGIVCPKSRFVQWNSNIDGVDYPAIIKPSHQQEGHYNEFKFKIIKNESELKSTLKMVRHESVFILQDYIPKECDILVYGGRMWDGKTLIAGALLRLRQADNGDGSFALITENIPKAVDVNKIAEYLERIDYKGPFSFEYGLYKDKAYFYEVNLRNDGTSHYFLQAGANIPLAYVKSVAGEDYSNVSTKVTGDNYFIDELFDIGHVIYRRIKLKEWKKDMKRATIYKYYDKDDTEPWRIMKRTRWITLFKNMFVKKFRIQIVYIMDKLGIGK